MSETPKRNINEERLNEALKKYKRVRFLFVVIVLGGVLCFVSGVSPFLIWGVVTILFIQLMLMAKSSKKLIDGCGIQEHDQHAFARAEYVLFNGSPEVLMSEYGIQVEEVAGYFGKSVIYKKARKDGDCYEFDGIFSPQNLPVEPALIINGFCYTKAKQ